MKVINEEAWREACDRAPKLCSDTEQWADEMERRKEIRAESTFKAAEATWARYQEGIDLKVELLEIQWPDGPELMEWYDTSYLAGCGETACDIEGLSH
jgi:hypothetical protein